MAITAFRHAVQKPLPGPLKLDAGHELAQGLAADWVMNEYGSNTVVDSLGRGLGTITGSVPWVSGPQGAALSFSGNVANYVSIADGGTTSFTNQDFTILITFKSTFTGQQALLSFADATGGTGGWEVFHGIAGDTTGKLYYSTTASPWEAPITKNTVDGNWHTCVIVINSAGSTGYFDGVMSAVVSDASDRPPAWTGTKYIGVRQNLTNPFTGQIARVAMWGRALTTADVARLYAEPYAMYQARPIQKWFFVSTNANHLVATIHGTSTETAAISITKKLSSTLSGVGTLSSSLTVSKLLSCTLAGHGTFTGPLSLTKHLTCTAAGTSAVSASLSLTKKLSTTLAGAGTFTGGLAHPIFVTATLSGKATFVAALHFVPYATCVSLVGIPLLVIPIKGQARISTDLVGTSLTTISLKGKVCN